MVWHRAHSFDTETPTEHLTLDTGDCCSQPVSYQLSTVVSFTHDLYLIVTKTLQLPKLKVALLDFFGYLGEGK